MKHMRKWMLLVPMALLLIAVAFMFTGCVAQNTGNRVTHGTDVQTFTYAYIRLGDKDIAEGYITQWRDYYNSDTVQIMIDGKYYLTHYSCVVMIADPAIGNPGYSYAPGQDRGN